MQFDIWNCPDDWISLKGNGLYDLLRITVLRAEGINSLSRKIDVPSHRLRKFTCQKFRRTNISISDLQKILGYIKSQEEESWQADLRIRSLGRNGTIINPKFPINFSSIEGARTIADVLTDGALSLPRGTVEYMNSNEQEIVGNIKSMNILFCNHEIEASSAQDALNQSKIKCKVYKYDTTKIGGKRPYFILKYPQSIGNFFLTLGLPPGKKVYTDPKIPEFILSSNETLAKVFLERVIINEGHVKPTCISIGHSTAILDGQPPELVKGYRTLFNKLGVETSRPQLMKTYKTDNGTKHAYWRITITGRSLDIVRDSFKINVKQTAINKRTFQSRWKPHQRLEQILDKIHEKRSICGSSLAKSVGVSPSLVSLYARDLESTGKVRRRKVGVKVYYELVA